MTLRLKGLEIPKGFEPRVVRGSICRMQLPDNWYNHFSGFLFCVVPDAHGYSRLRLPKITTRMKHVKLTGFDENARFSRLPGVLGGDCK